MPYDTQTRTSNAKAGKQTLHTSTSTAKSMRVIAAVVVSKPIAADSRAVTEFTVVVYC